MRHPFITGAAVVLAACEAEPTGNRVLPPTIDAEAVAPNAHNVLSALVSVRVRNADSVAVLFRIASGTTTKDSVTPAVPAVGELVTVPVLGLLAATGYTLQTVAYGAGGTTVGKTLDLSTAPLPPDLPRYVGSGSDPSAGYVVFAAGKYGVVIDNTGRVVWYHHFPDGLGLSFMAQPNAGYVARPPTLDPADMEPWLELDPLGNATRELACARGLQSRPHDLIAEPDGSYWIMCDETRTMDLTGVGGLAGARVMGTVVQHVGAAGSVLFEWSPFDHFDITDLELAERTGENVNWTHGNSLDLDADGNVLVSFRSLGEVTKINASTGAVIWRLGGRRNQFAFVDTPMPAFSRQHSARTAGPGALLLLDNVGDPVESRAERFVVDESTRTARLAHSYGSIPGVVTQIGGSVQTLDGSRTLVSFGTAGRVEEYDATGRLTWRIEGNSGYVFRAQRIHSLYAPGVGTSR
jgi:hypothetical protein